ncbi:OmpA family protein [Candidatus Vallotia lariciata]|uniref:OmpA family protein n=1 Tax=Candidatus Vallotia laricis TaxID=2018052 RepID=UPI001D00241B|nr:OmpA family protein [Candidatus Vallotia lariciata]UDG83218.1 OOP family OmpA-OmpF porin [Candidatus Vallotia lariciata]
MHKLLKLVFIASTTAITTFASADPSLASQQISSDNWVGSTRECIWMNGDGELCWRNTFWTPTTTNAECGSELMDQTQELSKPLPLTPTPVATRQKVTYQANILFDFDKTELLAGKKELDELTLKIQGLNPEEVLALGYTDKIGSDKYNERLSLRRAQAVKRYLISKGIPADSIYTEGQGNRKPLVTACPKKNFKELMACLAPNRRVEIEVITTTRQPQNELTSSQTQ